MNFSAKFVKYFSISAFPDIKYNTRHLIEIIASNQKIELKTPVIILHNKVFNKQIISLY